jgi:hypothetical protein
MLIGNLASTNYFSAANLAKIKESKMTGNVNASKHTSFGHDDTYIPSADGGKAKDIDEIKSRVKTGFYNTVEVNDDLTDFFSSIFKKTLY